MTEIKSLHPRQYSGKSVYVEMAHMEVLGDMLLSQNMSTQHKKNVFTFTFLESNTGEELCSAPVPDDVNSLITLLKKERKKCFAFFF